MVQNTEAKDRRARRGPVACRRPETIGPVRYRPLSLTVSDPCTASIFVDHKPHPLTFKKPTGGEKGRPNAFLAAHGFQPLPYDGPAPPPPPNCVLPTPEPKARLQPIRWRLGPITHPQSHQLRLLRFRTYRRNFSPTGRSPTRLD